MKTTRESTFSATLRTTLLLATLSGLLVAIGYLVSGGNPSTTLMFLGRESPGCSRTTSFAVWSPTSSPTSSTATS